MKVTGEKKAARALKNNLIFVRSLCQRKDSVPKILDIGGLIS